MSYGNWSKYSKNWIAGPTHEVCMQHIPGYTGHVNGIVSENLFFKVICKMHFSGNWKETSKGFDVPPKIRYESMSLSEFNPKNFRRFGKH